MCNTLFTTLVCVHMNNINCMQWDTLLRGTYNLRHGEVTKNFERLTDFLILPLEPPTFSRPPPLLEAQLFRDPHLKQIFRDLFPQMIFLVIYVLNILL